MLLGLIMVKRILDFIVAGIMIFLLSPIMLLVAILVRTRLGSPILFKQTRPGLSERQFMMYKFRSMTDARHLDGTLQSDDKRLTPFGQFLRTTSLDELPELWNVLKGDMSLVGPRPLLPQYLPLYSDEQARRHEVKPGVTGWAQIQGRNALSWEDKFKLDVWYVDNRSLLLDFHILLTTLIRVLRRNGISQPGHVTMKEFLGRRKK